MSTRTSNFRFRRSVILRIGVVVEARWMDRTSGQIDSSQRNEDKQARVGRDPSKATPNVARRPAILNLDTDLPVRNKHIWLVWFTKLINRFISPTWHYSTRSYNKQSSEQDKQGTKCTYCCPRIKYTFLRVFATKHLQWQKGQKYRSKYVLEVEMSHKQLHMSSRCGRQICYTIKLKQLNWTSIPWAVKLSWLQNAYSRQVFFSADDFDWNVVVRSGFISRSMRVRSLVSACSDYNLCHPGYHPDTHTQTDSTFD